MVHTYQGTLFKSHLGSCRWLQLMLATATFAFSSYGFLRASEQPVVAAYGVLTKAGARSRVLLEYEHR